MGGGLNYREHAQTGQANNSGYGRISRKVNVTFGKNEDLMNVGLETPNHTPQ